MSDTQAEAGPAKPRSCADCPSFLTRDQATEWLGTDPGAAICAQYGHVMDRAGMTGPHKRKIQRTKAKNCTRFGSEKPELPDPQKLGFSVVLPDIQAMSHAASSLDELEVKSCTQCAFFVQMRDVEAVYGWKAGICAAKGKLISGGRAKYEAIDCDNRRERTYGGSVVYLRDLKLLPELADSFAPTNDPLELFRQFQAAFVEPNQYETDAPVSDLDRANGIRAWRAVEDYKTGKVVTLPIYTDEIHSAKCEPDCTAHRTPEQVALIPRTNDPEHPELYLDYSNLLYKVAVLWRELDETPAVWGIAGTGKTELFRWLSWLMQTPFRRFSITASSEVDDLVGKMMYEEGKGTYFQEGRLVKAWREPGVIVIDEPNTGPPDVWQLLRPLTDNSKQLVLDQFDGQRVIRHDEAYLGFAMNPNWDPRNQGTTPLADADMSRLMHVKVDLPPKEVEAEIIRNRCLEDGFEIDADQMAFVLGVAEDLRNLSIEGTFEGTWGVRNSVKSARLLNWMDPEDALAMAVADALEPQQVEAIMQVARLRIK